MNTLLICLPSIFGFAWVITTITNRAKAMEERGGANEEDYPAFLLLITVLVVVCVCLRYSLTGSF